MKDQKPCLWRLWIFIIFEKKQHKDYLGWILSEKSYVEKSYATLKTHPFEKLTEWKSSNSISRILPKKMLTQMHKVGMWVCIHTDVYVSAICNGEKRETTKICIRRRMVTVYLLEEWNSHICSNMKISARHSS